MIVMRALSYVLPFFANTGAKQEVIIEKTAGIVTSMDAVRHFQRSFQLGVLDSAEVVFFLTWTGLFLFLTARSLEARRWRG